MGPVGAAKGGNVQGLVSTDSNGKISLGDEALFKRSLWSFSDPEVGFNSNQTEKNPSRGSLRTSSYTKLRTDIWTMIGRSSSIYTLLGGKTVKVSVPHGPCTLQQGQVP